MSTIWTDDRNVDIDGVDGPLVSFRFASAAEPEDSDWVEVALPLERLPAFYWAALQSGLAIDIGTLIEELQALGANGFPSVTDAVGPERRHYRLRVDHPREGVTVLTLINPLEYIVEGLRA